MTETVTSEKGRRKGTLKGGHDPVEMARRSAAARAAKRDAREQTAEENALTVRQKVGVALSKLTQREWDDVVKGSTVAQRVQLMNQAFGTPSPAEDDVPQDAELADLSREQRATLRAMLEGHEESDPRTEEHPPTPASDEPLSRESPGGTVHSDRNTSQEPASDASESRS